MSIPQNILSVKVGDELFAFDGDKIEQILRVPSITKMPLASNGIKGVSSLSGKIVTIIDLGIVVANNKPVDENRKNARILTICCDGSDYALLVDEVLGMENVDETSYEESNKDDSKISGLYKKDDEIYQIVDECVAIGTLDLLQYTPVQIDRFNSSKLDENIDKNISSDDSIRSLFLTLGEEQFAISLDIAREIVFVPEHITPISEAGFGVMGMITLRDELIVAIDLRKVLGIEPNENIDKKENRLLIVNYRGYSLALLVDSISEVKDMSASLIEKLPDKFADSKIESIFKAEENIVSIISKSYLVDTIKQYSVQEDGITTVSENENKESNDMTEVAVFQIANEEFAIGIEDVQEIIKYTQITPIPEAPEFVDGVINLRGVVIPIVSLPQRLGFEKNINSKSKILVCIINEERVGLLVDDVNEIMFIEDRFISKSDKEDALFSDIITLNDGKRIILKLQVSNILEENILNNIKVPNE
jgi:purine-binding chemotaxis protein CheW